MLDKRSYRPVKTKWTSDWREHFDWTFFQKEINCTLCTLHKFCLSTVPFDKDKTKMGRSLYYFPGTCTFDVPLSADLYLCVRLLSSWQTFVIFSTDWAESRMTPSQKTAAARLVCIQWWWTCVPMLLHHSRNIYLSPDTFRCFNAIHDTMPSRIHDIETFVASLKPGNTTQCSFFHVYFHSLRADCMIVRHSPKSLVGLAQNSFLNRIYLRRGAEVGIYLTLFNPGGQICPHHL